MGKTENNPEQSESTYSFIKKVLIVVTVAASITILVLFIWYALELLLLIFVGVLLGVILRSLRDFITKFARLPHGISLAVVVLLLCTVTGGMGYLLGPQIYRQANTLYNQVPIEWENFKQEIYQYDWGKEIVQENPNASDIIKKEKGKNSEENDMTTNVLNIFEITFQAVAGIILIVIIAIYIAAEPQVYTNGLIRLVHKSRRKRALEVLDEISTTIQWWIVGQVISMIILGTVTSIGLWLLDIPYPLILGLFTALMTFIPNIGPIIAGVPTLLVALTVSPASAFYVGLFYIFIQSVEGYFITPMIHREVISVPPVLIICVQFLLFSLIGFIGILVAMPLIACFMVVIRMIYVEDILKDSMDEELPFEYRAKNIF